MKYRIAFSLFILSLGLVAQQKITKTVKTDAPYVEIKTDGIDNLIIEESDTDELEMTILDQDGLGFVENFSCNDFNCVLNIKTEVKVDNAATTSKVNYITQVPQSNVSAVVKIPKNKKVTIFGETIDIQTQGYLGILRILIDKGNVRLKGIKGITEINLFSGNVFANVRDNKLDIKTRKGIISLNDEVQKSPYRKKKKKAYPLIVKSINANIVLTQL